eukprot:scaffold44687_cov32-Attheya_sp.AAC.1
MGALVENQLVYSDIPPCLMSVLQEEASKELKGRLLRVRDSMGKIFYHEVGGSTCGNNFPSLEEIVGALRVSPLSWKPQMGRIFGQNEKNYETQKAALDLLCSNIDKLLSFTYKFPRSGIVSGIPGSGKSRVAKLAMLYAMSKGLVVMASCIEAERAQLLGGDHIHHIFCVPVNEKCNINRLADLTLVKLEKSPMNKCFIQRLDVLLLDEIGKLGASFYAVLDIIFRKVR